MSGMAEAAGGVDSARSNSSTKKATNMFIPATRQHVSTRRITHSDYYPDVRHLRSTPSCVAGTVGNV